VVPRRRVEVGELDGALEGALDRADLDLEYPLEAVLTHLVKVLAPRQDAAQNPRVEDGFPDLFPGRFEGAVALDLHAVVIRAAVSVDMILGVLYHTARLVREGGAVGAVEPVGAVGTGWLFGSARKDSEIVLELPARRS
jgi:hypothetical protein